MSGKPQPIAPRFWSRVDKNGPIPPHCPEVGQCWVWTGQHTECGYGRLRVANKQRLSHRVSWFLAHGQWPGLCVLHRCDNPACVNPGHLFEGTRRDNVADMVAKGRNVAPEGLVPANRKVSRGAIAELLCLLADGLSMWKAGRLLGLSDSTVQGIVAGRCCANDVAALMAVG